jgi:hypothetical protein
MEDHLEYAGQSHGNVIEGTALHNTINYMVLVIIAQHE